MEEEFQIKRRLKVMRKAAEDKFVAAALLEKQNLNDPLEQFCEGNPVSELMAGRLQGCK